MLSRRHWTRLLAIGLLAILLVEFGGMAGGAVCARPPCQNGCTGRCAGGCMCYPNVAHWGYFPREWRAKWPGEVRPDVTFPSGNGSEILETPPGTKPTQLPKERYAEPSTGSGLPIKEGPSTGPIGPQTPFQLEPGMEAPLPGLPVPPQTPPTAPSPLEGTPPTGATPPIPPAPSAVPPLAVSPAGKTSFFGGPGPSTLSGAVAASAREPILPGPMAYERSGAAEPAPLPTAEVPGTPHRMALLPEIAPQEGEQPLLDPPAAPLPDTGPLNPGYAPAEPRRAVPPAPAEPWDQPPGGWRTRRSMEAAPAERPVAYEAPVANAPLPQAPVGLDGYCPVRLVRTEQWVEGNRQLAVEYQGRTYLISGPEEHRLFRAHPERYAPVASGYDVVLAGEGGGRVPGRTDACVVYEGRLYMFSDQTTLNRFKDNPKRYAQATLVLGQ